MLFCRSFSSITEKINGIAKKDYSNALLKLWLGLLTFNKLSRIILLDTTTALEPEIELSNKKRKFGKSDTIRLQQRTYIKNNSNQDLLDIVYLTDKAIRAQSKD